MQRSTANGQRMTAIRWASPADDDSGPNPFAASRNLGHGRWQHHQSRSTFADPSTEDPPPHQSLSKCLQHSSYDDVINSNQPLYSLLFITRATIFWLKKLKILTLKIKILTFFDLTKFKHLTQKIQNSNSNFITFINFYLLISKLISKISILICINWFLCWFQRYQY